MLAAALGLVEPDEHGRVLAHGGQEQQPVARGMAAEHIVLPPHEIGIAHLFHAGGEMAVPEQHHFLLQRARPVQHAVQPPAAQFHQPLLLEAVFLLLKLTQFLGRGGFPGLLVFSDLVRVGLGPSRIGDIVRNIVVINKVGDGRLRGQRRQLFDLIGRAAKPGPVQQMGRRIIIPMT